MRAACQAVTVMAWVVAVVAAPLAPSTDPGIAAASNRASVRQPPSPANFLNIPSPLLGAEAADAIVAANAIVAAAAPALPKRP
jgi:hypothetical protein